MKKKYYIVHDRDDCIGCGACEGVCPKYWKMSNEDGKATLKGSKKDENGKHILGSKEKPLTKNFEENIEASECCVKESIEIIEL